MLCASAPLPEPGPISCGQVLIVNFVLYECRLAELFRRHGKPPAAHQTASPAGLRERGVCVISRTAQASELSQPGEGGDDEDKARFVSPFRVCSDFASKAARRNVEEQEDLAAARRVQNVAINELETAQQAFTVLQNVWLQEFKANGNTEEAKQAEAKKDKAKEEVEKAKKELEEAKKELKEAEQKYASKASVQAGRVQAGASAFAVVAVAFGLQHSRVCFRAVHRFCFLGSCSPLGKDSPVVKLHCFGLQHFGEREGLLAALGSCKSGCPSCFAEASERGVSPRLEVGGGGQPVFRSL